MFECKVIALSTKGKMFCRFFSLFRVQQIAQSRLRGHSLIISASFHWFITSCASFKAISLGRGVLSSSW